MSTEALQVVKIGVAGIAIGSAVSWGGDMVFSRGIQATGLANPVTMNNLGTIGAAGVQLALAGGFGALVLYGGDQIMQQVSGGSDPLFHVLFYNTCYQQSGTIALAARAVRQLLDMTFASITASSSGTVATPALPVVDRKQETNRARNRQQDHQKQVAKQQMATSLAMEAGQDAQNLANMALRNMSGIANGKSCSKPGGCGAIFR